MPLSLSVVSKVGYPSESQANTKVSFFVFFSPFHKQHVSLGCCLATFYGSVLPLFLQTHVFCIYHLVPERALWNNLFMKLNKQEI